MTWPGWEDYKGPTVGAKRSKYNARRVEIDGMVFDSKREAARHQDLVLRMKAGEIRQLRRQPRYALCPLVMHDTSPTDLGTYVLGAARDVVLTVAEYVADFEYYELQVGWAIGPSRWAVVIEDVKGKKTDLYILKKKWFEAQYGVKIRET